MPRADARRNREALLSQATELIAEHGPAVALDEVARAAGVGNATLYRHFPDRAALLRAIAVQVIGATAAAAEQALAEETGSFEALARYLREVLGVRVAWVMPAIARALEPGDAELAALRGRSVAAITTLIKNAQRDGVIRADLTFGDISLLLIRLARPLPPGSDRAVQDATAQRHLAIMLAGLRPGGESLPGTGLALADLRQPAPAPPVPHSRRTS
ncbi:MAG TPA: helix-turn-helix domain-containing protein [Streptosporangiaceae bacterium]